MSDRLIKEYAIVLTADDIIKLLQGDSVTHEFAAVNHTVDDPKYDVRVIALFSNRKTK